MTPGTIPTGQALLDTFSLERPEQGYRISLSEVIAYLDEQVAPGGTDAPEETAAAGMMWSTVAVAASFVAALTI